MSLRRSLIIIHMATMELTRRDDLSILSCLAKLSPINLYKLLQWSGILSIMYKNLRELFARNFLHAQFLPKGT